MNLATGSLVLLGLLVLVAGIVSKLIGLSLLAPFFISPSSYMAAANSCFLMGILADKYHK